MSDDTSKWGQTDRNRIITSEDDKIGRWHDGFGVRREARLQAVERVGPPADDGQRVLKEG